MRILLTNDDGIHAAGLAAMERELTTLGDVMVVAPSTEQSGVSQSITFLRPLVGHKVYDGDRLRGYAVDGTPADAVKLGVTQYSDQTPDLIVSGINGGLNAGINTLYSGTVGGAMEGALFGIPSFAVSLEYENQPRYDLAARIARQLIEQTLANSQLQPSLININIPTRAVEGSVRVKTVPLETRRCGHHFVKRTDPKARTYYWATNEPPPEANLHPTDVSELASGFVTVTPLHFDLTDRKILADLQTVRWETVPQSERERDPT